MHSQYKKYRSHEMNTIASFSLITANAYQKINKRRVVSRQLPVKYLHYPAILIGYTGTLIRRIGIATYHVIIVYFHFHLQSSGPSVDHIVPKLQK